MLPSSPGGSRFSGIVFQGADDDNVTEISDYSDYKIWPSYHYEDEASCYEGEAEAEEYDEKIEDEEETGKEERERLKPQELIDIFADLVRQFRDKRAERIAAKAEERKEKLRQLIGLKKKTEGSEETLITPEEEIDDDGTVLSSDGSLYNCLKDIEISNSQLKLRDLDVAFPVPDDPGVIPAFWIIRDHSDSYTDCVDLFVDLVKRAKIQPIKAVEEMLLSNKIGLQYYGINPRIVRPLCEALMSNHTVEVIDLTGNWLSEDACYHLSDLLQKNNNIHTLLLAGCRIGPKGAWRLHDGIMDNATLTKLDLSDCNIGAEGMEYIGAAVCQNRGLMDLSLNDNHLDESCANHLQQLITSSDTLTCLRLSWNSLYTAETWSKLCRAIEVSDTLVNLDLSWNALGQECANHLRLLLSRSPLLKKLNLRGNRFKDKDAAIIAKGLSRNKVLEKLYLGDNPLKADGAITLIRSVTPQMTPESELRLLDLTNIWAKKDVLVELQTIEESRPWLKIKLGGILSNYEIKGPNVAMLLFKRANFEAMRPKRKRQRKNFGHFVLSLEEKSVSRTGFMELVKNFKLKLSPTLVEEIAKEFIGPKNTVDLKLLKSVYMKQYPETEPLPEKPEKKKRKRDKSSKSEKKKQVKIKENNSK
ncbi:uncharacterized protein LOC116427359 [Nomia melanderi]|uniref:uncharacterized protein LOC116427359 n=1 Tax=Nomia melanderi TaxID=2448451 RepID=UPI003FCDD8E3